MSALEPILSLGYEQAGAHGWRATLHVSGLPSEQHALVAIEHLRRTAFGGVVPGLSPLAAFGSGVGIGRPLEDGGSFRVALFVTGLATEQQAQAAAACLQRMFCGEEQVATQ